MNYCLGGPRQRRGPLFMFGAQKGQQDDILLLWAAEKNEGWTDKDRSIKKPPPPKKTRPHKQRGNFSSLRTVEAPVG